MPDKHKRVNILITEKQHKLVAKHKLSLSGLVRDLLDDWFSESSITLHVTQPTKQFYDTVVSNYDVTDPDIEPYLVEALDKVLADKADEIDSLRKKLKNIPDRH